MVNDFHNEVFFNIWVEKCSPDFSPYTLWRGRWVPLWIRLVVFQTSSDPPPPHFRKIMLHIFFYQFHAHKALFKGQNLQRKSLDWKWPTPPPQPPFGAFPKIHPFWWQQLSYAYKHSGMNAYIYCYMLYCFHIMGFGSFMLWEQIGMWDGTDGWVTPLRLLQLLEHRNYKVILSIEYYPPRRQSWIESSP